MCTDLFFVYLQPNDDTTSKLLIGHSSYVQQLAWNVLAETGKDATEEGFENGVQSLIAQCSGLFEQHIQGLTSYQLNFIRAICDGVHTDFGSKAILEQYNLGTK